MSPEEIRANLKRSCLETILVEIAAQLAALNEKFADFFEIQEPVYFADGRKVQGGGSPAVFKTATGKAIMLAGEMAFLWDESRKGWAFATGDEVRKMLEKEAEAK